MSHLHNNANAGRAAEPVQVAHPLWQRLLCLLLSLQIGLPLHSLAAPVAFSPVPLARASTPAAPNVMFILDESGSMGWDYMPDQVNDNSNLPASFGFCWDSGDDDSGRVNQEPDACQTRDAPFRTAEINGMSYNPAVTYTPGVTAAGVSKGAQTTFTAVQTDPYLSPSSTTNLLNYSEDRWCDALGTTCVTNTAADGNGNYYRYPDGVYVYRGGSVAANPHFYTLLPTDHCTDETLTVCVASSTPTTVSGVTYAVPAKVRWCKYTGGGSMDYSAINYTDCQAKRTGQYQYPKYLGFTSPGGSATPSYGTITIGPANPIATDQIVSVTVGATNLIPGVTMSGFTSKSSAAAALAYYISNKLQGYMACSGPSTQRISTSSTTSPPGCSRAPFNSVVPSPGSAPTDTVYIIPTTGVGSTTPATGAAYNSPTLPAPVVTGIPAVIATRAAGSITIGDSGSDRYVRISKVDIGATTVFSSATLDETGGTNSAGERNSMADKVRDAINSGGSGYVATTASNNVVTINAPITGTTDNGKVITVTASQALTGSITINDSLSDAPVRISKVDIGATNIFTANKDANGGTNSSAERNALADLVRDGINVGAGGFTATTAANNVVTIVSPITNSANNTVTVTTSKSATGSITINDSGSDAPVRISKVDIGATNIFTANQDANGGTNSIAEQNALANLVRDAINGGGSGFTATTNTNNVVAIVSPLTNTANSAITVTSSKAATGTISITLGTTPQPVRISSVTAAATPLMSANVDAATGLNSQAKIDAFAAALATAIQNHTGAAVHNFTATASSGANPAVVSITSPIATNGANVLTPTVSGGRRSTITLVSPGTTAVSLSSVSDGATLMTSGATVASTTAATLASGLVSTITANGYTANLNTATSVFAYQPLGSASVAIPTIIQSPLASAGSSATATIFTGPAAGFTANQRVTNVAIAGGGCASTDANMLTGNTANSSSATAMATNIAAVDDGTAPSVTASGASIIITGPVGTSMAGCTVTVTKSAANNASFGLAANPAANTANPIGPLSPTWSAASPVISTAASAIAFATVAPTGIAQSGMAGGVTASTTEAYIVKANMAGGLTASTAASFIGTVAMAGGLSASTTAPFISTVAMAGGVNAAAARLIPNSVNGFQGAQDIVVSVRSNAGIFARVDIVSGNNSYPYPGTASKASSRSDCAGATCTYDEEMTNFANWYAYYRTRLLTMKTAAGLAFKDVDGSYRAGFMTIHTNSTDYLKIDYFEDTPTHGQSTTNQKTNWYSKFYGQNASSATPLRSALSLAGRVFSGKNPLGLGTTDDPVQYSCQQNFAILTTDGLWNSDSDTTAKRIDGSSEIGNTDNDLATAPLGHYDGNGSARSCPSATATDCVGTTSGTALGKYSSKNTLADVAYYYYNTDLRDSAYNTTGASATCSATTAATGTNKFNSCCGQPKGGIYNDVCTNEVKGTGDDTATWQHMTTFTLGLGVDGALQFKDDYKTAATGDFAAIKAGSADWPQVKADDPTTADDLWHAAVNGHGTYYSARDPSSLSTGLANTLSNIAQLTGSGAAAATSNLEPQAGDNFAYVGSYTTLSWTGNLEARTVDIGTGAVSPAAIWCVEDVAATTVNGVAVPGCSGRLKLKVATGSDSRQIHLFDHTDATDKLRDFTEANLTATELTYFDNAQQGHVTTGLSQYSTFDAAKIANATTTNMVAFLRGQNGYEAETTNPAASRIYRNRDRIFGDVIGSQPVYVKKPFFSYLDTGYLDFKNSGPASTRDGSVYIGGNDGMLHALDALTGDERWSYIPSQVMPSMYRLADSSYSDNHRYYVDGSVAIGDVFDGTDWKTILVGGFNSGGRGYYALDITVPSAPKGLWEYSSASKYAGDVNWDANMGSSLGNAIITKLSDGTWVVIVSSGYNNISPGNGRGYLYVLDAITGNLIRKIEAVHKTGTVGDTTTPSNLGKISAWVTAPDTDNTALHVYGGDLKGNVWRFDPNVDQNTVDYVAANPKRLAILKDASGVVQPITTRPELGLISGTPGRIILIGTGKYLESSDVSNTQLQTVYGIADRYDEINNGVATTDGVIPDVRDTDYTVAQTMSGTRTLTGKPVDFTSALVLSGGASLGKTNWLVDLPVSRERVNVDPQLVSGTLLVASNIPSSTSCTAGGSSFLNFMDYKTGGFVGSSTHPSTTATNSASSAQLGAIIVGFVTLKLSSGKAVDVTMADSPTPVGVSGPTFGSEGIDGLYSNVRAGWREIPVE